MGWRFRRTLRVAPGISLNLSKSGVSTSMGVRGAHVTMGHGQTRTTVGVPGSGVSYTSVKQYQRGRSRHPVRDYLLGLAVLAAFGWWMGWL